MTAAATSPLNAAPACNAGEQSEDGGKVLDVAELQTVLSQALSRYDVTGVIEASDRLKVFSGRHRSLNREVLIKVVQVAELEANASVLANFRADMRAMARVSHPSLLAVHDAGEAGDGIIYSIVEKETGTRLSDMLAQNGAFGWKTAAKTLLTVAQALACAHEHGLWHKGLKAEFIWLSAGDELKVSGMCGSTRRYLEGKGDPEKNRDELAEGVMRDMAALGELWLQMLRPGTGPAHGDVTVLKTLTLPAGYEELLQRLLTQGYSSMQAAVQDLQLLLANTQDRPRKTTLRERLRAVGLF